MTGFGSAIKTSSNFEVSLELKSLNSKYFDFSVKLPQAYAKYEYKLRTYLSQQLLRGKVSATVHINVLSPDKHTIRINQVLAKAYVEEIRKLQDTLQLTGGIDLPFLMNLPEVLPVETAEEDPEEWALIEAALKVACGELVRTRKEEGAALSRDMRHRCEGIAELLEKIESLVPVRAQRIRDRLQAAVDEIRDKLQDLDKNRFEQELIYYLERWDINEEIVRLRQHLVYFEQIQAGEESNGKQLQFLSQEMGREINTIGAKANDADIQRLVVKMKDELEKIKEQVLNIV